MTMKRIALAGLLLAATSANAAWQLDGERSALSFVSTKAINIAEVHRFGELSGGVDADGMVNVSINLDSVDTAIELRDDRMKEMLFEKRLAVVLNSPNMRRSITSVKAVVLSNQLPTT